MENKSNDGAAAPVAENGANAVQKVSRGTQTLPEPTKRSLRVETWKKILEEECAVGPNAIFNRIPSFKENHQAANLLAETPEFNKAKNIKVNLDRPLHSVHMQALLADKTLYLPSLCDLSALYLRVNVPVGATEKQKKDILNAPDMQQHCTAIYLDDQVKLDLVVIGSVLVSRDGYHIGRGNGFADLDIGLLIEIGSITRETVIATIVDDMQVVDSLPDELFEKHDTPIDMIVTPTEVIHCTKTFPRPTGIFWELVSERRLSTLSVLQELKESEEEAGRIIILKDNDADYAKNRRSRMRRRRFKRPNQRHAISQADQEQQGVQRGRRRRRPKMSEGDQSDIEGNSQERKTRPVARKQRWYRTRMARDYCIKLSKITRDVRIKDVKLELRKRNCRPLFISWKGQYGKCYLHFGSRNEGPTTDEDINSIMNSLTDFQLTVKTRGSGNVAEGDAATAVPMQTVNITVQVLRFDKKNENRGIQANEDGDGYVVEEGDDGHRDFDGKDDRTRSAL